MDNKQKLNDLFKRLRKQGVVARQNFSCCGGCAASALHDECIRLGKEFAVYYHRQDAAGLREGDEHVYLGFGAVHPDASIRELKTCQLGKLILDCAREVGLEAEWDGSPRQRVCINLPGGV